MLPGWEHLFGVIWYLSLVVPKRVSCLILGENRCDQARRRQREACNDAERTTECSLFHSSFTVSLCVMESGLLQLGNGGGYAGRQHDAFDQVIS